MIELSLGELRSVTAYAVACAEPALSIFEQARPDDHRPHGAIEAARAFAEGAKRSKAIRDSAWSAQRAYQETCDAGQAAASEAARAAVAAAGAAFLHPLAKATQVWHILGAAGHAAYACELAGRPVQRPVADPVVVRVLSRYPNAPGGRGRAGELVRELDALLRKG
ncbi:putative immunity protein [Amycolatopsis sp. WGS_07]|uniref:putative immunity protein n=1 Tax=Amycolatopsis sp. WGS_07 TaxID=3076764 RepID=UPI003872BD40